MSVQSMYYELLDFLHSMHTIFKRPVAKQSKADVNCVVFLVMTHIFMIKRLNTYTRSIFICNNENSSYKKLG